MSGRPAPEQVWDRLWRSQSLPPAWDDLSELIQRVITRELPGYRSQRILEVGSGSGRISLALARGGAEVYLLDTSGGALAIARGFFQQAGQEGNLIQGSVFAIPLPDDSLEAVWSAGLIEHFPPDQQAAMVEEMIRVLRPGGSLLLLVPNRRAFLYDLARRASMRLGTWPYGPEEPLTAESLRRLGFGHVNTAGRYHQLYYLGLIRPLRRPVAFAMKVLRFLLGNAYLDTSGAFGYLLYGTKQK